MMYKDIPADFLHVIEPVVESRGLEIVDASVQQGRGRIHVRVVLDTPQCDGRVTIDECAAVSREIGHNLDTEEVVAGSYLLEVCSPGVDRTLGREKDFVKVVGQRVEVQTGEPMNGRRRFRGELVAFDGRGACVRTEGEEFRIPFDRISRAQAFYPFESGQQKG